MNRDQKQLELLYEQVVASEEKSFLFDDEKQFIEAMVSFYLKQFKTNPVFQEHKNKDRALVYFHAYLQSKRPLFSDFCQYKMSDVKAINMFYNTDVAAFVENFILINNVLSKTGEKRLAFRFVDITDYTSKKGPLFYLDKNLHAIEQKIRENLVQALKLRVFPKRTVKSSYEQIWFDWREERTRRTIELDKQLSDTFSKEDLEALEGF
jgi:hypothetical protein